MVTTCSICPVQVTREIMQALAFYKSAPAHLTKNQEAGRAELARSLSIQYLHSIYIIFTQ